MTMNHDEIEKYKHDEEEEEEHVDKLGLNPVTLVDTCCFKSNLTNSQALDDDFSKTLNV